MTAHLEVQHALVKFIASVNPKLGIDRLPRPPSIHVLLTLAEGASASAPMIRIIGPVANSLNAIRNALAHSIDDYPAALTDRRLASLHAFLRLAKARLPDLASVLKGPLSELGLKDRVALVVIAAGEVCTALLFAEIWERHVGKLHGRIPKLEMNLVNEVGPTAIYYGDKKRLNAVFAKARAEIDHSTVPRSSRHRS